ncbi:MAG: Solute-binding protein [Alphaproteobacteria bacterium MarineAlpha11_Bin1]|nr:MAG: Solute-binding protein [Alphaproteobacteria bacterium MarineAlpha11_Bin1]|tara:strand:- start:22827 stop:23840 length:1014 start_codon:yes stop_codon:yes gene_type:complete
MSKTLGKIAATGVAAATAIAISLPAQAGNELKVSTALGQKHDQSKAFFTTFLDPMKKDQSEVTLNYIGGPEVTPNRKQGPAMKRGLIDIIMSPSTYYATLVPEARLTGIATVTPQQWRKNGGYEMMSEAWGKKLNAIILGWGNFYGPNQFFIWLKDKPKLSKTTGLDLKGLKMRTTPLYTPFFKAMGATTKNISPAEVYTALERGVVDGLAWPEGGVAFRGWHSYIKYKVGPGFFRSSTMVTMNKDKFNKLSKKGQKQILAAGLNYENTSGALLKKLAAADNAKVYKQGVNNYTLPGEYGKAFTKTIVNANWNDAGKRKYNVDFKKLKAKMLDNTGS